MTDPSALAARLKELRLGGWNGMPLTQPALGKALRASVPLLSSWENGKGLPPVARLDAYARLFAIRRPPADGKPRVPSADQLDDEERATYERLLQELIGLRDQMERTGGTPASPLQFPPGQAITIVCSELPARIRSQLPYSSPDDPDYVQSYKYGDLDPLIELLPRVGALNPTSSITVGVLSELSLDDLTAHLIALGGVDFNLVTKETLIDLNYVPVRQLGRETERDSGGFSVRTPTGRRSLTPRLSGERENATLQEDVAHFLRAPNPYNRERTLTFFTGMYSRGSYGAVRALTDPKIQERNAAYIARRFAGAQTYSIVSRVKIVANEVVVPDWTLDEIRLHEWPEAEE
ncbi:MAG TPA: helix-turn-helix transcriptional regulator [Actinoplanes sp.]